MKRYTDLYDRAVTSLCLLPTCLAWYYYHTPAKETYFLIGMVAWIAIFEWPRLFKPRSVTFWLLFPVYPILSFIAFNCLMHNPTFRPLIPFMILLTFAYDAGGYFIGKAFGKHKLLPQLSPNKTVEGAVAGVALTFFACWWYRGFDAPFLPFQTVLITLAICVCACAGDLFESFLKRKAGIKDTSNLLPGNGGLLDRIDALLCVVLFVYATRSFLITYLTF